MLDARARAAKEWLLWPIAGRLAGIHPTVITAVALVVGLAAAVAAAWSATGWALAGWLVNRTLDGLDGTLARAHQKQTDLGGYLDILGDFIVYAAVPVGLVLGRPSAAAWLWLALLLAVYYVNTASWMFLAAILEKRAAGAKARGEMTTVTMPAGIIGGTETVIFYGLFILFSGYLPWLFGVFAGLLVVTIGQRFVWAMRMLD